MILEKNIYIHNNNLTEIFLLKILEKSLCTQQNLSYIFKI